MIALVLDQILNTVFHKAQFWVHHFLVLILLTYFMNEKKKILQTMLTTQLPIRMVLSFLLSFLNYRVCQQKFLMGLVIIIWKPIQVNVTYYLIQITSSTAETLLGITIDSELNFENQLSAICNKVSRRTNALGRIVNYMPRGKLHTVIKTFIEYQFNYQ